MKMKQGISLIVLVITIIVMTILAGAIIITLNNSGIIENASEAVEKTNLATVKELAQTAWASAYAAGERTAQNLKDAVDIALENNKVDINKYGIEVTENGVDVVIRGPWIQTGETVTDGETTIKVGEKINYTATGTDYSGDWKVLGASKWGELLIMSDSDVTRHRLGYKSTTTDSAKRLKECQEAYLNGASELDEVCEPYGKGRGAIGARSINIEDINKVIDYDHNISQYGKGYIYEYGNEVTYLYNGTKNPEYIGTNETKGILSDEHSNGFYFYNGKEFVHVNDLTTGTRGTAFATIKSDFYDYFAGDLEISDKASLLIFGESNYDEEQKKTIYSNYYWLASSFIRTFTTYVSFGIRSIDHGQMGADGLLTSNSGEHNKTMGVRAVVTLAHNIKLTGSSETGWSY